MVNIRRRRDVARKTSPVSDQRAARAVARIVADDRSRILPSDERLTELSDVSPEDIDRAVDLWDTAQDDTGLSGMLDARLV